MKTTADSMFNRADDNIPGIQSFYETGKLIGDTQGWIRGYEAGCRDGALKKERDIARNLLIAGIPVETVASCTGLSEQQVRSIAENPSGRDDLEGSDADSE